MAFAWGFSIMVGLGFMPYELHSISKCNFYSKLYLYIKYWHLGHLCNQILLTYWLLWSDDLSNMSSSTVFYFHLTILVCICSVISIGSSTTLSQLEVGLIMAKVMKTIAELYFPLSANGPTRLMHKSSYRVLITILDGKHPYFCVHLLFTWQVLHDFAMDQMVLLAPFQYITAFTVSSRRFYPGCWR